MTYLFSCIYLTRSCTMHCEYCRIRNSTLKRKELSVDEWKNAFKILKDLGVEFNLILGNEPLMLKDDYVKIIDFLNKDNYSYATYTTFPEPLWGNYKQKLVDVGIKNVSGGLDYLKGPEGDILEKSCRAFKGLKWCRDNGIPDYQGTITLTKTNIDSALDTVETLSSENLWSGVNIIHYAKDNFFDFFPTKDEIKNLIFTDVDKPKLEILAKKLKEGILEGKYKMQNPPEYLDALVEHGINLDWHCNHKLPLIFTVDADGTMRTCGYRQGPRTGKYSIFDLENKEKLKSFMIDWSEDIKECPGCFWSYWWMTEFYLKNNPEFGKEVFKVHASKYYSNEVK